MNRIQSKYKTKEYPLGIATFASLRDKVTNERKNFVYLKLTDACHTKANNKKKTGIIGNTLTIGSNGA